MTAFRFENRDPCLSGGTDVFDKRQMHRRRWKRVFPEPTSDCAEEASVVKVEVRPVAEQFEMLVSSFANRFQEVYGDLLTAIYLSRDSEIHPKIVNRVCAMSPLGML